MNHSVYYYVINNHRLREIDGTLGMITSKWSLLRELDLSFRKLKEIEKLNENSIIGCSWNSSSIPLTLMIKLMPSLLIRLVRPRLPVLGANVQYISLSLY